MDRTPASKGTVSKQVSNFLFLLNFESGTTLRGNPLTAATDVLQKCLNGHRFVVKDLSYQDSELNNHLLVKLKAQRYVYEQLHAYRLSLQKHAEASPEIVQDLLEAEQDVRLALSDTLNRAREILLQYQYVLDESEDHSIVQTQAFPAVLHSTRQKRSQ